MAARLASRLERIYRLPRAPATLREFGDLLVMKYRTEPRLRGFIALVRSGEAAIGETSLDRGYSLRLRGGREARVMCGYDALMTSVLAGGGLVRAACPHCGETMDVQIEEKTVTNSSPPSIVFWLGAPPGDAPGNPVCDHLHLFPSREHLNAWVKAQPDELGVATELDEFVRFLADSISR